MNDYLKNIDSLDDIVTNTSDNNETIPKTIEVLEFDESAVSITSADSSETKQLLDSEIAPYMKSQKVTVRKYRLKK